MSRPAFDPQRLDVRTFADGGAQRGGALPPADLQRLADAVLRTDAAPPPVRWSAQGESRPVVGGRPEVWLRLQADTTVTQQCQRCLQPMAVPLAVDRGFRFVASEEEAERLDEESEDDVLVESRRFDLLALIEDELILALPLVPRHDTCPQPLPLAATDHAEEAAPNPFAALAALRRPPGGG
jgi:uncharacterized protein